METFLLYEEMIEIQKIIYVGIGGFIGASLRYIISINSPKLFGTQLPYGTLLVNILGEIGRASCRERVS